MIGKHSSIIKSLIGIELEHGRMHVVKAARNGDGVRIKKAFSKSLSLDPLTTDPELFGHELRNHLNEADIRESRCIICLPLKWILKHRVEMPELSDEDRESFIALHAEREFPFTPEELSISTSDFSTVDGERYTNVTAIPLAYVRSIETACKAARLHPLSITFGFPRFSPEETNEGILYLKKRDEGLDYFILDQQKIISFRWLENESEEDLQYSQDTHESILREIRVSLNGMPLSIQKSLGKIHLCGNERWVSSFSESLQKFVTPLGIHTIQHDNPVLEPQKKIDESSHPLCGAIADYLQNQKSEFEFLPPKVSKIQQWVNRVSSRGSLWLGGTAAAVLILGILVMLYQHFELSRLESEWNAIEKKVAEVETLQENVKQFRPWFNDSFPSLSAMQTLTQAFPENGTVWTKNVEIANISTITCSGFARDNRDLLLMLDQLNKDEQVKQLQVQQVQGESPIQFVFQYLWTEG